MNGRPVFFVCVLVAVGFRLWPIDATGTAVVAKRTTTTTQDVSKDEKRRCESNAAAATDVSGDGVYDDCGAVCASDDESSSSSPSPIDRRGRHDAWQPRTGLKTIEKMILIAMSMFIEKMELAVYMSLYKIKVLYSTLIAPLIS